MDDEMITCIETPSEPDLELKEGVVVNCLLLNVREKPERDARIMTILEAMDEVFIDETGSTEDFYKIRCEKIVDGYCMKKFIAIKE